MAKTLVYVILINSYIDHQQSENVWQPVTKNNSALLENLDCTNNRQKKELRKNRHHGKIISLCDIDK
jgi:hypothetical protein